MAMSPKRIVFIGAAGEMCRLAIERFAVAKGDWELAFYDIRPELLDRGLGTGVAAQLRQLGWLIHRGRSLSQRRSGRR